VVSSSESENETMSSEASRLSKSRTANSRSQKRKLDRRAKFLAKCQELYEASGREFKSLPKDIHAARCVVPVEEGGDSWKYAVRVQGSVCQSLEPGQISQVILERANKTRVSLLQKLFIPSGPPPCVSKADFQRAHDRSIVSGYCHVCSKHTDPQHEDSSLHRSRVSWAASCDALMGPTPGPRVYASGLLAADLLTEEALKRFWGSKVMEMASVASSIIRTRGLVVKKGKKSRVLDGKTQVAGVTLAFVQYGGQGKYHARTRMVWAHQLPYKTKPRHNEDPLDPAKMWWPTVAVSFPKSVDRELATYMAPSAEAEAEAEADDVDMIVWDHEEEVAAPAPPPSLPVQDGCPGSSTDVVPTSVPKCIWLSCQDQLQRDTPEAWACPASRL
jgi:hypothetical protein